MNILRQLTVTLNWIGPAPYSDNKTALLIPQYNESSNCNIEARLMYFKGVAEMFRDEMDIIIIDDGSTDDSLEKISSFLDRHQDAFYVASVLPNSNKVGALCLTARSISHEFVILSDFDTDITGYNEVIKTYEQLREDNTAMGCYFRMIPFEGKGPIFNFQQIEYATLRALYKFYKKEGSVPVMPGAGACYKRQELLTIYDEHSGLRSGEDREATMIGLKLGYKTHYKEDVLCLTRPPLTYKMLVKQRVRWNLGYLETYHKERKYYAEQVRQLRRIGIIFLSDLAAVIFMITLPFVMLLIGLFNIYSLLIFLAALYVIGLVICISALLMSPKEFVEIGNKLIPSILAYPVLKLLVGHYSWWKAIRVFFKTSITDFRLKVKEKSL
jgi:cellulose synthase/poly-beta-1,6-N-acetylglucosamine synthase-like glycosyltransferase